MTSPKSTFSSYPSPPPSPPPTKTTLLTQTATIHNLTTGLTLFKKHNEYLNNQVLYLQGECERLQEYNEDIEDNIETLKARRRLKDENTRSEPANGQLREMVVRQQALMDALANTMQLQVGIFGSVLTRDSNCEKR